MEIIEKKDLRDLANCLRQAADLFEAGESATAAEVLADAVARLSLILGISVADLQELGVAKVSEKIKKLPNA